MSAQLGALTISGPRAGLLVELVWQAARSVAMVIIPARAGHRHDPRVFMMQTSRQQPAPLIQSQNRPPQQGRRAGNRAKSLPLDSCIRRRLVMKGWFGAPRPAHAHGAAATDAYRDARAQREDVEAAYRRGRNDERKRRRGSPVLSFLLLIVAAAAVALIYLAAQNGSFSGGGAVVDRNLQTVSKSAQAPFRGAAGKAGDALEHAGQSLKQQSGG